MFERTESQSADIAEAFGQEKIPEEEIERVMDMVQNIESDGIAYAGVRYVGDKTIEAVLRNGLIDVHNEGQKNPDKQRALYVNSLKDDAPAYNKSYVYFNITGRVEFGKYDPDQLQIEQTMWSKWKINRFVVLFDTKSFKEVPFDTEKMKNFEFRPQSDEPKQNVVEGFMLEGRVSPRFFTGIVLSNYYLESDRMADSVDDRLSLPNLILEMEKAKRYLPIYDVHGNLLWPKEMSYEEVKEFVKEQNRGQVKEI